MAVNNMFAETAPSSNYATSLFCARIRDELTISLGETEVYYSEVVTVVPDVRPDNLVSERNRAIFYIVPVLVKELQGYRLLFPVLKPTITMSSGKVSEVVFKDSDSVEVEHFAAMTVDGMHRFMVVFGREIPKEITIVISMTAQRDPKDCRLELLCKMSDDGMGRAFGKPDSRLRILDSKGTQFVFRNEKVEMRPDARGWVSVEAEKQYLVEADFDIPALKPSP